VKLFSERPFAIPRTGFLSPLRSFHSFIL
jgi:hypothetical protein